MANLSSLPVLLIAFNRPILTKANLQMISKIKPEKLFFSVDGPRKNSVEDLVNVNLCKDLIQDLDWKCKLFTNFSASNLGSGIWPYESINWAETYKYYPPNGIQYINPYQRRFPCTDTRQLCVPAVPRKAATPVTTFSQWNRNPVIYLGSGY
jgi:hypothetical protein